jgi:uncharacterized protein involved in outer membrane biogenesis
MELAEVSFVPRARLQVRDPRIDVQLYKMRRRLFVLVTLLIAGSVAIWLIVRSTLNPDVIRRAAESRLSTLLAQPVSIGNVRVLVFPVPAVIGSDIAIGPQRDTPDLALERIRIVPRLASLFRGPYVIRNVTLDGLTVRIVRELGLWKFPPAVPVAGGDEGSGLIIERVRVTRGRVHVLELPSRGVIHQTSLIDDIEGEAVAGAGGLRVSPIRGRVGSTELTGDAVVDAQEARLDFRMPEIKSQDLGAVLGLSATEPPAFVTLPKPASVSLSIRIDRVRSRLSGTGSLRAPEVSVDTLRLQSVAAPIRTDGVRITFDPMTFSMYGGTHSGTVVVDLPRARWTLDSKVTRVDVGQFLSAYSGRDQRLDGTASAAASLHAGVGEPLPRSLVGRMQVEIVNGVVREFPLLAAINRALRLTEGNTRDTRFERLSATLAFAGRGVRTPAGAAGPGHATTNDLLLEARDVRVEAAGRIGFDRSLDLAGQAVLSPERSAEAIRRIRELSGLRTDRGGLELPISISGTLDDPSISIDVKAAVGRSFKEELRRRFRDLIRR